MSRQLYSHTPCSLKLETELSASQASPLGNTDVSFLHTAKAQINVKQWQVSELRGNLRFVS